MTHSNQVPILLTTLAILALLGCSLSKTDYGFRKLSPEEILPISAGIPQFDSSKVKYCGPPGLLSVSAKPLPLALNKFRRIEANFTAGHDLIAGDFIVNYNRWPYKIVGDACEFALHKMGVPLCPILKGETYFFYMAGIPDVPKIDKGHYVGNITLVNSDQEVVLCFSIDVFL